MLAVRNSVGITIDPTFSFAAGFPALESLANSLQVCYCSVDTELLDRNNCAKNQLNGFITTVELQFYPIRHPVCGDGFRTMSSRIQALETTNVLAGIFEYIQ